MDQSIRICWYDLPESRREEYLSWLHEIYLPKIQSRAGVIWVAHYEIIKTDAMIQKLSDFIGRPDPSESIPTGSQFAMMIAAGSPHYFFKPNFDDIECSDATEKEMMSLPQNLRAVVTAEQARVNGPEFGSRTTCSTPAPFIQLGHFRVRSVEEEFDLVSWYADYRFPAIARMTGAIRARKMLTVAGWAKHVVMYEFTSRESHEEHFMGHESLAFTDGEWTNRVVLYTQHAPGSPSIGQRIWPKVDASEGN